jgi:hypothetical protein
MFTDRSWLPKLVLALGAFLALSAHADWIYNRMTCDPEDAVMSPEAVMGRPAHFWARRVLSVQPDGLTIRTRAGPCRLVGRVPAAQPGDLVSAATTVTGRATLTASRSRINAGYEWKRKLMYGMSILTLAAFLVLAHRHLRGRLREGFFRSRS